MRTIDTRGQNLYSPLIPAIKAMCEAGKGEKLESLWTMQPPLMTSKSILPNRESASGRFMTERKCWYNSVSN